MLFAQNKDIKKQIKAKFEEVKYYYQYDNFHLALPVLLDILKLDSTNIEATYKTAICIYNTKRDKQESYKYFEKSQLEYKDSWFYLGLLNHDNEQFDISIDYFKKYKNWDGIKKYSNNEIDYYMNKSIYAKEMINSKISVNFQILGDSINTTFQDYAPVLLPDESMMFFTSRRSGGTSDLKDPLGEFYEDIYVSYNKLGKWSSPVLLAEPVNTKLHDACVTISSDGQELYTYRTNADLTGGDIYLSKNIEGKWSVPEKIKADINSKNSWTPSASITPDNNYIYISSNREGGFGGKDIYRVTKLPNCDWSLAENLGSVINTPYDEDAPFIHPDGKTLFFSSKGHRGMGSYDIFKTTLNVDGTWSAPENIGYPLNSVKDDIYYVATPDGKRGYFSSNRKGGIGETDIYSVDLLDHPSNYIVLRGTVTTNDPVFSIVKVTISIIDFQTNEVLGIYRTNTENGKYLLVLLPKRKYKMVVESEGFQNFVDEIDMSKKLRIEDIFKNITLQRLIPEQPKDVPEKNNE
ncbi:MAG: hypothetical protein A2046_10915 [Bacteroidetes bacterium GWA2_30_7]|nr:MAG: hypothetical protein A2046_10915 [Bacteroidetes bacterium GWA2_30_7]